MENELRRGNIIAFDDGSTDIVKVNYIFFHEEMWFVDWIKISGDGSFSEGRSLLDDFKPIPLTAKVVSNCGFETHGYNLLFWKKDNIDLAGCNLVEIGNPDYDYVNFTHSSEETVSINYLHQLQNLYFLLTGKELEITI